MIEIVGCSGAGKTSLIRAMVETGSATSELLIASNALAVRTRTAWLRHEPLRNVAFDLVLTPWFLEGARDHASFVRIARRLIVANAHSRFDRISRVRALRRQLASHVVHSRTSPAKTTLIDEGILGSVHSALVYCHRRPDESEVIELANAMPKPDLIVHLDTPIEVCVARALRRSDPPLRGANAGDIEKFVRNGHEAFQFAGRAAAFEGRWKTLVPEQSTNDSQALANDAWKLISKHLIQ